MTNSTVLFDPTSEKSPAIQERNRRPKSLAGLTIGLLDISKAKGEYFSE